MRPRLKLGGTRPPDAFKARPEVALHPKTKREVFIRNAHPRLRVPRAAIRRAIAVLDAHAVRFGGGCPAGELSLAFLTDPALAKLHADFMADPTPTDVITFEGGSATGLAGEICVSADTAARFVGLALAAANRTPARKLRKSGDASKHSIIGGRDALVPFGSENGTRASRPQETSRSAPQLQEKFATELTLYLVHGWLHLAGYDDLRPVAKRRMRAAEKRALGLLHAARAVPAFLLV